IDDLVKRHSAAFSSYLARWRYRRDFKLLEIRETVGRPLESGGQVPMEKAAEDVADALKRKPESVEVLLAAADLERLRGRIAAEATDLTNEQRRAGLKKHRDRAADYLKRGLELVARTSGG